MSHTLTIRDLVKIGEAELSRMAVEGELSRHHLWVAMKGGWEYAKAVARGDVRANDAALRCMATCRTCEARRVRKVELRAGTVEAWHCGPPFEEHDDSCGCLVGLTINGEDVPAGAALVGSKHCIRGNW